MRSPDELAALFRSHGLKVTPQRRAVFDALHGDDGHPNADVIWTRVRERIPSVSLRTVYQALNDLVDLGEVQAVSIGNGASRFDPNTADHDHFVCHTCERVYDVIASRPRVLSGYAGPDGSADSFTVDTADIIFRGLCASCGASTHSSNRGAK